MHIAERMFLRGHKNHFWILCHGIYTKDLGYVFFRHKIPHIVFKE
jgi:hypothetical protein